MAKVLNVPQPAGLLVQRVAAESPAADLGIEPGRIPAEIPGETLLLGGDVILEVAGLTVTGDGYHFDRIMHAITTSDPAASLTVRVLREGRILDLTIRK